MSQVTLEKLNDNIFHLQKEIELLRSFIIGLIGKDKEGEYNPEFIKSVLKANTEKTVLIFKDKKTFLSQIQKI